MWENPGAIYSEMDTAYNLRREYSLMGLNEPDLASNPVQQFANWFDQAVQAGVVEPNAMTLATASPEGLPSARIVLLREFDDRGFTFFTSYESQKGRELDQKPHAALVFFWESLERQVRVSGPVSRTTREESEKYFQSRPQGSQIAAWASYQSQVVESRPALERRFHEASERFAGQPVPLPPYWGGFRLYPISIEFWQGRPNRLHDRFRYTRIAGNDWQRQRLCP